MLYSGPKERGRFVKVTFAVACDFANRSDGGKLNIVGIFNELYSTEFPYVRPEIYVVVGYEATVAEEGRTKHIRVVLLKPDNPDPEIVSIEGVYTVRLPTYPGRPRYVNSIFHLPQVEFPEPGDYAFHVLIGGDDRERVPVHVYNPQDLRQE
jgi:hypothetical protein